MEPSRYVDPIQLKRNALYPPPPPFSLVPSTRLYGSLSVLGTRCQIYEYVSYSPTNPAKPVRLNRQRRLFRIPIESPDTRRRFPLGSLLIGIHRNASDGRATLGQVIVAQ